MQSREAQHVAHLLSSICLIGLLLGGCEIGDDKTYREKDIAALKEFLETSGEAVSAGDVEGEVNRFTEDGIYMWPDAPSIQGHERLRQWFERRFSQVDATVENVTAELEVCGDWAFERGTYVARVRPKDNGKMVTVRGKYLNILKRQQDGSWKIARRIRNRDHPASQP
jgi:ketosteroid isomerase-like protein